MHGDTNNEPRLISRQILHTEITEHTHTLHILQLNTFITLNRLLVWGCRVGWSAHRLCVCVVWSWLCVVWYRHGSDKCTLVRNLAGMSSVACEISGDISTLSLLRVKITDCISRKKTRRRANKNCYFNPNLWGNEAMFPASPFKADWCLLDI